MPKPVQIDVGRARELFEGGWSLDRIGTELGCSRETIRKHLGGGHPRSGETNGRYRHGKADTKIYRIWSSMIRRCGRPEEPRYADYGGRGITVCERWLAFENFYADMGDPPEGRSLDRVDNDKGYSPENCRWATPAEQNNNRRSRRSKFSPADREEMRRLYEDGESHAAIAKRFSTHGTYVGDILRGLGVEARRPGTQTYNLRPAETGGGADSGEVPGD